MKLPSPARLYGQRPDCLNSLVSLNMTEAAEKASQDVRRTRWACHHIGNQMSLSY